MSLSWTNYVLNEKADETQFDLEAISAKSMPYYSYPASLADQYQIHVKLCYRQASTKSL